MSKTQVEELARDLSILSGEHALGIDVQVLRPLENLPSEATSFYVFAFFSGRSVRHHLELGESPSGAYPELLKLYAATTEGEFCPHKVRADSDDDWESLWLEFECNTIPRRFRVSEVEDSDWFTSKFVAGLNRFAARVGLRGRWVDFYDGDDSCTSIYVPKQAVRRLKALRRKYSAQESLNE